MVLPKSSPWARLVHFVDFHRTLTVWLIAGMVVVGAGALTGAYFLQPKPAPTPASATSQTKKVVAKDGTVKYFSPLTGNEVPDEATTKRQITAIMIENSLDSRPQSGIKSAGVVYEAIAEGGITRLLTLFQEARPSLVGPVRSIRPYYVDWAGPYDAAVAHVGGSFNALQTIRNGTYKDIDQFFNGSFYWRASDRVAPHNVYTSFDKLDELNTKKGFTSSNITGWPHKLDSPAANQNAKKIDITVSSATFNVSYTYDTACNCYNRNLGGKPHTDREAGQLTPKVVIAMKVPTKIGFEDGYREQMDTNGHNQAYVFQDGTVYDILWRKADSKAPIHFYDKTGKPLALNAGQTWITVIAPNKSVTWQ